MSRKLRCLVSAFLFAATAGMAMPARASDGTSLLDCLQGGGHQSGKYCSGGSHDGRLILG